MPTSCTPLAVTETASRGTSERGSKHAVMGLGARSNCCHHSVGCSAVMQSLTLALANRGEDGDPLPLPFQSFEDYKIRFKRSQLSLIAAAPGGMKSSLAAYIAVHMAYDENTGVPALYICADSDAMTVGANVLAGLMDIPLEEAERKLGEQDAEAFDVISKLVDHVWWCFKPSPTLDDIYDEIQAYAYVYGRWPEFIVVDNLVDIAEPGEEYQRYQSIMQKLVEIARESGAHVCVLHHVTGAYSNGDQPIPRDGIKHKTSEKPSLVLTLYKPEEGLLGVRVVKNRSGPAHTKGMFGPDIACLPERGFFGD